MIKENQKLLNQLNVISDAAIVFVAMLMSYMLIFNVLDFQRNFSLGGYMLLATAFVVVQLITFGCLGLYGSFRTKNFIQEFGRLVSAFIIDGILMLTALYVGRIFHFSRWALFLFLVIDFIIVSLKRFLLRRTLKAFREKGYNKKFVLLVGSGTAAREYLAAITEDRSLGLECVGYVGEQNMLDIECMGGYESILSLVEERHYDEVVCALDYNDSDKLADIVEACELTGTKISVVPVIYKYMSSTPAIDMVGGIPVMNIRRIPLDNMGNAFLKRAVDIVGALVLIILTSPIMLVSALVIKLTMGGKVIFKQKRVGLNKKIFTMYKLKSMKDSVEAETAWSTDYDPRKTRFGSFIRKFSIDELPQLFNVLKGDMSLVGPRPEIPFHVNNFKDTIPMYMIKHQVKPGITGLAQVNGYRGDTSIQKRIEYDIQYIENWTFFLDLSILLRTLSKFMNKEKLKTKKYKAEKYTMNKTKTDYTSLAIFFPSVIALAIIPILMQATYVITSLSDTFRLFGGTETDSGRYYLIDVFSQCKGFAVVLFAIIMLVVALICCVFLFRRAEKRSLAYVGASVVYVVMSLLSALGSAYPEIAFFGAYDRAEGFYTTACYFVIFLFTMFAFRKTQNFRYILIALCICTGVNAVLGIFQFTGNNLMATDWFSTLIIDRDYSGAITFGEEINSTMVTGALYHYNYVGSFTGLVIPLFTTLALFDKKIVNKIIWIVFDLLSVFMLFGSTARSGMVAVAAAVVVGLIVFGRILIKHWKPLVGVVVAAIVLVVGANFATSGKLFERISYLIGDVVSVITPADGETDLFEELPCGEIRHNDDGSVSFVTKTDALNVKLAEDGKGYTFTDNSGQPVDMFESKSGVISANEERFAGLAFEFDSTDGNPDHDNVMLFFFEDNKDSYLVFQLFNDKMLHMVDYRTIERIEPVKAESIGFEGKERVGSARGYIWSRTFPLLKNCLITGYGPDTFAYEFPQTDYIAKYHAYYNETFHMTVDKVHNLYLQIFFSNGLIALIAFLGICIFYLVDCFRLYALRKEYREEQIYGVGIMLGVVGYLVAGLFNDSVVSVAPVFWILLGTGCALNTINRRMDNNQSVDVDEGTEGVKARGVKTEEKQMEERADVYAEAFARQLHENAQTKKSANREVTRDEAEALLERVRRQASERKDKE